MKTKLLRRRCGGCAFWRARRHGAGPEVPRRRGRLQLGQLQRRFRRGDRPRGADADDLRAVARRGPGAGRSVLAYFAAATGVDGELLVVGELRAADRDRHAGRRPPDIAVLPQPGLIADMAAQGLLAPLGRRHQAGCADNYAAGDSPGSSLGTYKGNGRQRRRFYAFPYKIDVKSAGLVRRPRTSRMRATKCPRPWKSCKALTEQIVADGGTPWCIGLGSGGATGWPATDWVEDMMLRTQRPRSMTSGRRTRSRSTTRAVVAAIDEFGWFAKDDANVAGGAGRRRLDRLPRQPEGPLRVAAAVLHAPPGVVHPVLLPRRDRSSATTPTSSTSRPTPARISASPVLGAGTLAIITKDTPGRARLHRVPEDPDRARGLDGAVGLPDAA